MTPLTDAQLRRIGDLAGESLAEWWRRIGLEGGLELSDAEIAEMIDLSKGDEATGHQ